MIFVVGRVLIFNLHSSCIKKKRKEKKKRKALNLDAIFFKDKLFFLNVRFYSALIVCIVVVYGNKKKIFSKGHMVSGSINLFQQRKAERGLNELPTTEPTHERQRSRACPLKCSTFTIKAQKSTTINTNQPTLSLSLLILLTLVFLLVSYLYFYILKGQFSRFLIYDKCLSDVLLCRKLSLKCPILILKY